MMRRLRMLSGVCWLWRSGLREAGVFNMGRGSEEGRQQLSMPGR